MKIIAAQPGLCVSGYSMLQLLLQCNRHACMHQWLSFKFHPSSAKCPGSGTGITPGKHSDTRIMPLPLTNGHGRYITATPERKIVPVGEWPLHTAVINL
jgi:hypothetical protein